MYNIFIFHNIYYLLQNLGKSPDIISQIKSGLNPFSEVLKNSRRPMVILGSQQLSRKDGAHILAITQSLCKTIESQVKVCIPF